MEVPQILKAPRLGLMFPTLLLSTIIQFAPTEVRQSLIRVIDLGSRSPASAAAAVHTLLHTSSRFPHLCLSKMYVLCSRGQDSEPKEQSVRCQLEVAQV